MIDVDLNGQRDARQSRRLNTIPSNDPYDMEDFAMPLEEYIKHPVAWDIVHNGATFQVLPHVQCASLVVLRFLHQFLQML